MTKTNLDANAWIQAAFRALTRGGPQAIKAEAIARELGVSKGSFYWHFKNVGALKTQMLQHWRREATDSIIEALETDGTSAAERLKKLVEVSTGSADEEYGGVLVEASIRDWARYDSTASETVRTVDEGRLAYLNTLFEQCGFNPAKRASSSAILYSSLIGLASLSHNGLADLRADLQFLLETLLKED
ncbi:TetR/AcrR family transcriptional regulator [Pseudophaeobacter sp.]|uniref:TetR/AcrR family transcriptional regulator n=1 Tax=Pseudophaeobacter sp. TaxID=1971739 RepID=UPI00329964CA